MKLVVDHLEKNRKSQDPKPVEDFRSWDPFTQCKFIFEINKQTGTPIPYAEAYKTAIMAVSSKTQDDCPSY